MGTCASGGGGGAQRRGGSSTPPPRAPPPAKIRSPCASRSPSRSSQHSAHSPAAADRASRASQAGRGDVSRYLSLDKRGTTTRERDDCRLLETQAGELLQRQDTKRRASHGTWNTDKWPWPWLYAEEPGKGDGQDYYRAYLKTFRMLSAEEAAAWQAWKDGDHDAARAILDDQSCGVRRFRVSDEQQSCDGFEVRREPSASGEISPVAPVSSYERHAQVANPTVAVERYEAQKYPKSAEDTRLIVAALQQCRLFSHLVRHNEYLAIAEAMRPVDYVERTDVFRCEAVPGPGDSLAPDPSVQGLWVIAEGKVECEVTRERRLSRAPALDAHPGTSLRQTRCSVVSLGPGSCFGEELVTDHTALPPGRAVVASKRLRAFALSHEAFHGVMGRQAHEKRQQYLEWLRNNDEIPLHKAMRRDELLQLADALKETKYDPGDHIITFGAQGDACHFIVEGEVDVWGRSGKLPDGRPDPDSEPIVVAHFTPGHAIGFLEFFSEPTGINIADVRAQGHVITARIGKADFEAFMGPMKEVLQQITQRHDYEYYRGVAAAGGAG